MREICREGERVVYIVYTDIHIIYNRERQRVREWERAI